jgi:hypothetical protein
MYLVIHVLDVMFQAFEEGVPMAPAYVAGFTFLFVEFDPFIWTKGKVQLALSWQFILKLVRVNSLTYDD